MDIIKNGTIKVPTQPEDYDLQATGLVFKSYDNQIALTFNVEKQDGTPADLLGATLRLLMYVYDEVDGTVTKEPIPFITKNLITESFLNGHVKYILPEALKAYNGVVETYVYIEYPDGSTSDNLGFTFRMKRSAIDGLAQDKADYFIADFQQLLDGVKQEVDQKIAESETQIDAKLKDTNDKITKANQKITEYDQNLNELRNDLKLSEAWAWSADGTDRFTNVKPGENLIKYSKFTINTPLWYFSSSTSEATGGKSDGYFWLEDYAATERRWKQWQITFNDTNDQKESFLKFIASQNKIATLSFNALVEDETLVDPILILASVRDNNGRNMAYYEISTESLSEEFQRFSIQFKIPEDVGNITNFRVILAYHGSGHCEFSKPKLEFGKYTIYTPAPSEDYENAYPQYRGLALLPSDLPDDYSWDITPEYTEKGLNNTVSLTEPETVLGLKNFKGGAQIDGVDVATVENLGSEYVVKQDDSVYAKLKSDVATLKTNMITEELEKGSGKSGVDSAKVNSVSEVVWEFHRVGKRVFFTGRVNMTQGVDSGNTIFKIVDLPTKFAPSVGEGLDVIALSCEQWTAPRGNQAAVLVATGDKAGIYFNTGRTGNHYISGSWRTK